jgi:hypothetical protein
MPLNGPSSTATITRSNTETGGSDTF